MKKLVLVILLFLVSPLPVRGLNLWKEFPGTEALKNTPSFSSSSITFSDPDFSQPANSFSSGQIVYVRIETTNAADKRNSLRVLNQAKEEVKQLAFNRSGQGPFVLTASFSAPSEAGLYYLDIRLEDQGGSVYAHQENLNVGSVTDGVSASVKVESQSGEVVSSPTILLEEKETLTTSSPSSQPEKESTSEGSREEELKYPGLWQRIWWFLGAWLKRLFS